MTTKPREFWLTDNTDNTGWTVDTEFGPIRLFGSCNVVHVIEKSAYDQLAEMYAILLKAHTKSQSKLAIAVKALEQYKNFEFVQSVQGGVYSPKVGKFDMKSLYERTWNPAAEALAAINSDAKKGEMT